MPHVGSRSASSRRHRFRRIACTQISFDSSSGSSAFSHPSCFCSELARAQYTGIQARCRRRRSCGRAGGKEHLGEPGRTANYLRGPSGPGRRLLSLRQRPGPDRHDRSHRTAFNADPRARPISHGYPECRIREHAHRQDRRLSRGKYRNGNLRMHTGRMDSLSRRIICEQPRANSGSSRTTVFILARRPRAP